MSLRVGPIFAAIASMAVRITGEPGAADVLAVGALSLLTLTLHRGTMLQAAARTVHSCNLLEPRGSDSAYPIAH